MKPSPDDHARPKKDCKDTDAGSRICELEHLCYYFFTGGTLQATLFKIRRTLKVPLVELWLLKKTAVGCELWKNSCQKAAVGKAEGRLVGGAVKL